MRFFLIFIFIFTADMSYSFEERKDVFSELKKKTYSFVDLRRDLSIPKINKNKNNNIRPKKTLASKELVKVESSDYPQKTDQQVDSSSIEDTLFNKQVEIKDFPNKKVEEKVSEKLNENKINSNENKNESIISSFQRDEEYIQEDAQKSSQVNPGNGNILVKNSGSFKKKGISIGVEMPSVRHITMSPGSKRFGGDDVEIAISPLFDVIIQMPDQIEYFRASNPILSVQTIPSNLNMIALKLSPVNDLVPLSMHLIDVNQNIYTFTVIGLPADLSYEYPKTILVNKRVSKKATIGAKNPDSIFESMDIDDAIQVSVGDIPKTQEYFAEIVSFKYKHHEGYATYGFRIYKKDNSIINPNDVMFTVWADDKRLDGGPEYRSSREVEWTIHPTLTNRETSRRGYTVLRVFLQVSASILDIEEWKSTFITIADKKGYTRFDFKPISRPIRPPSDYENEE